MPRQIRQNLETSFFHVMVQGINKEYIFKKERYIHRYINLLKENLKDAEIKIISFCIMNNHSHLLINTEKVEELSKFMQKVNGAYAKYYNYMEGERVGYVFRDRYKCEPILNKRHLLQCVKYIHQNPVKAGMVIQAGDYKYSSYNYFNAHRNDNKIFSKEEMEYIFNQNIPEEDFIDIDINIDNKINKCVGNFIKKESIKTFEIFEKSDILKELIKFLKENNIKYTEIMQKFDITKGTMERLKR